MSDKKARVETGKNKEERRGFVAAVVHALESWRLLTRAFEITLVDNLAATAPWLAPLAPAYLAFRAMIDILGFPWSISIALAVAIEILGISTVSTTVTFWTYNHDKHQRRKDDPAAPTWLASMMVVFYLVAVLVVNVIMDSSGPVERTAKGLLSSLSIVSVVTLVLRASHGRRVEEVSLAKLQEKQEREQRRLEKTSGKSPEGTGGTRKPAAEDAGNQEPVYTDWRQVPESEYAWIAKAKTEEIVTKYRLKGKTPDRTARMWRNYAIEALMVRSASSQISSVNNEQPVMREEDL